MRNNTLRLRQRLLACSSFALLSLNAAPALATDWWMIFGTGDTPNRDIFFADAQSVKPAKEHSQNKLLNIMQVFENPNSPNYVSYTLELRCPERQLRVNSVTAHLRTSSRKVLPAPKRWVPVPRSWLERGYDFACAPEKRKLNGMTPLGGPFEEMRLVDIAQLGLFTVDQSKPRPRIKAPETTTEDVMNELNALLDAPSKK